MSWIPSSKGTTLVALLALLLAVAGPAGALTLTDETDFQESRVGETVSTTVVVDDPFNENEQWTLRGTTELENVSWTVSVRDQGNQLNQTVYGEQTFEQELALDNGGDQIEIELTGTTPAVDNYTYEPPQAYTLWELVSITGSSESTLNATSVHHYTNESDEARNAIDEAATAVNGSDSQEAQDQLDRAIEAYNGGQFGLANNTAQDAQNQAESAQQSQQQTQTLIYVAVAAVVLALVGGGIYYWRSNQGPDTKLQ